jgi:hypothetical protein
MHHQVIRCALSPAIDETFGRVLLLKGLLTHHSAPCGCDMAVKAGESMGRRMVTNLLSIVLLIITLFVVVAVQHYSSGTLAQKGGSDVCDLLPSVYQVGIVADDSVLYASDHDSVLHTARALMAASANVSTRQMTRWRTLKG